MKREPVALWRGGRATKVSRAGRDPLWWPFDPAGVRIELYLLKVRADFHRHIRKMSPIRRNRQIRDKRRRGCDSSRRPENCSRGLVDRHPPKIEASASVTGEIQETAVGGPHRIPIGGRVIGHWRRRAPG